MDLDVVIVLRFFSLNFDLGKESSNLLGLFSFDSFLGFGDYI